MAKCLDVIRRPPSRSLLLLALVVVGLLTSSCRTTSSGTNASFELPCQAPQLRATLGGEDGAAGNLARAINLRNVSRTPCLVYGYPSLVFLDKQHRPTPRLIRQGSGMGYPSVEPHDVNLSPGSSAAFAIGWNDSPSSTELGPRGAPKCPESSFVRIGPNGDWHYLTVSLGIGACQHGVISESALDEHLTLPY
jgi:hypothetical protein